VNDLRYLLIARLVSQWPESPACEPNDPTPYKKKTYLQTASLVSLWPVSQQACKPNDPMLKKNNLPIDSPSSESVA
jgi:hypothetical protein